MSAPPNCQLNRRRRIVKSDICDRHHLATCARPGDKRCQSALFFNSLLAVTTIFAARPAKASSICKFKASPVYNTLSCSGSSCWSTRVAKNEDSPAKLAILQEWDFWAKEHPEAASRSGSLRFFEYLKYRRPDLLMDFRASGDKWKTVRSWLRTARKVKD
jgi:hypothetical protein